MPAHLDDLEKIYLWGLKVVENGSSRYLHSAADFGPEGDREAWEGFLRNAAGLLDDRPTRRFIHWGSYEKSRIEIVLSPGAKSSCHPERSEGSRSPGPTALGPWLGTSRRPR
jgi:hypothetical protein